MWIVWRASFALLLLAASLSSAESEGGAISDEEEIDVTTTMSTDPSESTTTTTTTTTTTSTTAMKKLFTTTKPNSLCTEFEENEDYLYSADEEVALLMETFVNYTNLAIQWSDLVNNTTDLCGYIIYIHSNSEDEDMKLVAKKKRNETEHMIDDLVPGTLYHVIVVPYFTIETKLVSWKLVTTTKGFGPDNPCNCDPRGTHNSDLNECERMSIELVCHCKDLNTLGEDCSVCVPGYYMDDHGCTSCYPICPQNAIRSNGSCYPDPIETARCYCYPGYGGTHCMDCVNGYYAAEDTCEKCECNEYDDESLEICDSVTGECFNCPDGTEGPYCSQCKAGYTRDFDKKSCIMDWEQSSGDLLQTADDWEPSTAKSFLVIFFLSMMMVILVVIIVGVVLLRQFCYKKNNQSSWSFRPKQDHHTVNFSTLVEEQDNDRADLDEVTRP